jgi:hypothetical protein
MVSKAMMIFMLPKWDNNKSYFMDLHFHLKLVPVLSGLMQAA